MGLLINRPLWSEMISVIFKSHMCNESCIPFFIVLKVCILNPSRTGILLVSCTVIYYSSMSRSETSILHAEQDETHVI